MSIAADATLLTNLLSPVVLAFALGGIASLLRSDLRIPDALYEILSIYLLLAIGLKGGVALATADPSAILLPALAALLLGATIPIVAFGVLRGLGRFGRTDAAAIAAHYGSISIVTFVAGSDALTRLGIVAPSLLTTGTPMCSASQVETPPDCGNGSRHRSTRQ